MNSPATTLSRAPATIALIAFLLPLPFLLPFVAKAFHLDDPFYLWTGQQILTDPVDFYGYSVNWSGTEAPAWVTNKNPPLVSYYMALVAFVFGWGEVTMHLAFLLPACLSSLCTFRLAQRFTSQPLLATAAALATPAFLVSATNVMAEVVMLCFYLWAIELWLRGLERDKPGLLFAAAACIVASTLSKYFGVSLIPLLAAYTLAEKRSLGTWLVPFAAALGLLLAYELLTLVLYGQALLFEAGSYANLHNEFKASPRHEKLLIGLAYTGGCLAVVFFYAPLIWARKALLAAAGLCLLVFLTMTFAEPLSESHFYDQDGERRWDIITQFTLFTTLGMLVLQLAFADLWARRDAMALLLFLWLLGTFFFAAQVNWTTNARAILPMAPPLGIVLVRRLEARRETEGGRNWIQWAPLAPAVALCLTLMFADYGLANAARTASRDLQENLPEYEGDLWYVGHWGFQYYMQQEDTRHVDVLGTEVSPGDVLVIPKNNLNKLTVPEIYDHGKSMRFDVFPWATVWSRNNQAGLYSSTWGCLPYAFGRVPPEEYTALLISESATLRWEDIDEKLEAFRKSLTR